MREMVEINLSSEIIARLNNLPDRKRRRGREWTAEEDAALLKYWPVKRQTDFAESMGISAGVCRKRFEELTSRQGE